MMRCSRRRDSSNMNPLLTSTPISNLQKRSYTPITKNEVLSPILQNCSSKKLKLSPGGERAIPRARPQPKPIPGVNILGDRSNIKKNSKRTRSYKVNFFLEEIAKDSLGKSTDNIQIKSEESIDAIFDEVVQKSGNGSQSSRRQSKRLEEKENSVIEKIKKGGHVVEVRLVKKPRLDTADEKNVKPKASSSKDIPTAHVKPFTSPSPLLFSYENCEWKEVTGQPGVYLSQPFCRLQHMKIGPNGKFKCQSNVYLNKVLTVLIGNGIFKWNEKSLKVTPGFSVKITDDVIIQNSGWKKEMIFVLYE